MKTNVVVAGSVAALVLIPLALLWYRSRRHDNTNKRDRMDERQHVKKKKEKIVKIIEIEKEDVRFVIGKRGCVIKDIESRCGVKISFPEEEGSKDTSQVVVIKGDCNDDIKDAIEMIQEACQLKPKIITENIEIRAEYCGKIIGKGGENLKDIREHSGTRILISKEPVNGNQDIRLCSIEGTKDEIEIAKRLIDSNIMTEIEIRRKRELRQAVKNHQAKADKNANVDSIEVAENERFKRLDTKPFLPIDSNHSQETATESFEPLNGQVLELEKADQLEVETQGISYEEAVTTANLEMEAAIHKKDSTDLETEAIYVEEATGVSNLEIESISEETVHTELPPSVEANILSTTEAAPSITPPPSNHPSTSTDCTVTETVNYQESSGFTVEMTSESMELIGMRTEYDKVRTDLRIDDDVAKVELKDKNDFDTNLLLGGVCLPSLSPKLSNQDLDDRDTQDTMISYKIPMSNETLRPDTSTPALPQGNVLTSGSSSSSSILSGSMVNEQMTLNLKSMLGINKDGESLHDGCVLNTKALFHCPIYSYNHGVFELGEEFEGVVTSARCSDHVWVVNRHSSCLPVISNLLLSYDQLPPPDSVEMGQMYLFMDKSTSTNSRIFTLQPISNMLVECYDVDTGVMFPVPTKNIAVLPPDLERLPPAAVCVSIGSGSCVELQSSELIGQVVTVTPQDMGANKEIKYPRVKLHRDQIVYNNYGRYVSSPKPTETASLPSGSSLVYVSAIHNAGHFYVQACGKNISELDRLESAMAQHYGSVETLPEYSWDPVPGQMCGVWHTSEQIWLRGQIKELDNSDMLYIKYLDYGDTVHLPRSHTRKLRTEFMELPYQAIECFLANTIPITTRQWTPEATAKFDALTQCGQWYPLRCVVVGERHGKPCVELYDQPYSDKEFSVGECLCAMDYARSSKMEIPAVQTLSTPIPSFASGAAYLVSPDFDDVDDELEELFACDDDSDSADSDDFPVSRANVSNLLLSLGNQISPPSTQCKKNHPKYRPQTCGQAKNNAFMERRESSDSNNPSEQTTPQPQRKTRYSTQESLTTSDSDNVSESDQSHFYETPRTGTSPKSTTSSYASAAEFNNTFVAPPDTPYQNSVTPLHLSSAEDTDCG